jgi:hypothetical protein
LINSAKLPQMLGGLIRYLNDSSFRGRKFKQRDDLPNEPKPPKQRRGNTNDQPPNAKR